MTKGGFANEEVMEEYLDALLTETAPASDVVQQQSVAKLLEDIQPQVEEVKPIELPPTDLVEEENDTDVEQVVEIKETTQLADIEAETELAVTTVESEFRNGSFQALFFTVAGLTLAVPLTELGGIHNLIETKSLFGKPDWFIGVMLHRDEKLSVVDSAKWVMPEKYDEKLAESLNYQYLIMLDDSSWGLACEALVTTATLEHDDVQWREAEGKRPWLAGLVKEKKCALIDVKQLVLLLNKGLGSNN